METGSAQSIADLAASIDDVTITALGQREGSFGAGLAPRPASLATHVDECLTNATRTVASSAALAAKVKDSELAIVLAWAAASASRGDVAIAPLLNHLGARFANHQPIVGAALSRIEKGPYHDAMGCLAATGSADWVCSQSPARGRLELLLWRAGAELSSRHEFASWLAGSTPGMNALISIGSHGSLRARSLAARCLCVMAEGIGHASFEHRGRAERIAANLARHPAPIVWIAATRALGRLAPASESTSALLRRWSQSTSPTARRRATAALACDPSQGAAVRDGLLALLDDATDPWMVATLGPAAPLLARDRREVWEKLSRLLLTKRWGPEVLWSVTQGLVASGDPSAMDRQSIEVLTHARAKAVAAQPKGTAEAMLWLSIRRSTDFLDGLEPEPSDVDLLLERTALAATRIAPASVVDRVRGLALSLAQTVESAERMLGVAHSARDRAVALAALEGSARASALELWEPILTAGGASLGTGAGELDRLESRLLAIATHVCRSQDVDFATVRTALRLVGATIDRLDPTTSASAGLTAGRAVKLAAEIPALASSRRRDREALRKPLGELAWRVADALSHRAGLRDPLPHLALWWTLAGTPFPMRCLPHIDPTFPEKRVNELLQRAALVGKLLVPESAPATLGAGLSSLIDDFQATDTPLALALYQLVDSVECARNAARTNQEDRYRALGHLADARQRLIQTLADPLLALGADEAALPLVDARWREDAVMAAGKSAKQRAASQEKWAADLGPIVGPFLSAAAVDVLGTLPPRTAKAKRVGPYELQRKLGAGAMGEVWLVTSTNTRREFVMKLPSGALRDEPPDSRADLLAALASESEVLRALYHPNVASFVDYGWDGDVAYLVLERLLGLDLHQAVREAPLTMGALRPIVADVCAGLGALHRNGLVHRDLKPGNVFLRLDEGTSGPDSSLAARFRSAVLIDFGIAGRMSRGDAGGYVSGTPGFMPPEQARGETVDAKADVYSLAATVYSAVTGRALFDHVDADRAVLLHGAMAPFGSSSPHNVSHAGLRALLARATALDPAERPSVAEFARAFAELRIG